MNHHQWYCPSLPKLPLVTATTTTTTAKPKTNHVLLHTPNHLNHFDDRISLRRRRHSLTTADKVVFVMGATGTGKSRLSLHLATAFGAEIVNSDKMQVYTGLDVATNKVTSDEQAAVPHHLLGFVHPDADFTASDFRRCATEAVESILARGRRPIIAGGSNSYIQALVDGEKGKFRSTYDCCYLWVDVSLPVLCSFVSDRVDKMVDAGLVDEVRQLFIGTRESADYTRGIRRAIGVPEMDCFLRAECESKVVDDETMRERLLRKAVADIKANTCLLALRQRRKIEQLRESPGWPLHRIDATEVFSRRTGVPGPGVDQEAAERAWEELVAAPAKEIVRNFLHNGPRRHYFSHGGGSEDGTDSYCYIDSSRHARVQKMAAAVVTIM